MSRVTITEKKFLADKQGATFADVVNDPDQPFKTAIDFLNDANKQRRMEDSEIHHDRPPLAGIVRELESHPIIDRFFGQAEPKKSKRFRQAIGVMVRIIMEARGWRKTGRKGSLGVRTSKGQLGPSHNTGGLSYWFIRAERYELADGMPYTSVRERNNKIKNQ